LKGSDWNNYHNSLLRLRWDKYRYWFAFAVIAGVETENENEKVIQKETVVVVADDEKIEIYSFVKWLEKDKMEPTKMLDFPHSHDVVGIVQWSDTAPVEEAESLISEERKKLIDFS